MFPASFHDTFVTMVLYEWFISWLPEKDQNGLSQSELLTLIDCWRQVLLRIYHSRTAEARVK